MRELGKVNKEFELRICGKQHKIPVGTVVFRSTHNTTENKIKMSPWMVENIKEIYPDIDTDFELLYLCLMVSENYVTKD